MSGVRWGARVVGGVVGVLVVVLMEGETTAARTGGQVFLWGCVDVARAGGWWGCGCAREGVIDRVSMWVRTLRG